MGYQPFLVAPFATGLDTDAEPWLLPQDAFSNIVNGHLYHGVVEKRDGFTKLGDVVHNNGTNWDITAVTPPADPGVVSVASTTGLTNGDIVEIRDVDVGSMTELNGNQYTIGTLTANSFALVDTDTTNFAPWTSGGAVYLVPQDRVMGIERRIDLQNAREVIAFDTKRACVFNTTDNDFDPLDTADIMSGTDTDYIWSVNWASTASSAEALLYRFYFTNGKALSGGLDGIRFYDGSSATTTSFAPTINPLATPLNGCKLIFAMRERLLLLHTFEGANIYPQRARWCQAQNPGTPGSFNGQWDDAIAGRGGFVDAPTGDQIISARFVQDVLVVYFTASVWLLVPTANPALPFKWEKVNNFRGCDGKMATETFDRYVIALSIRGITGTDGLETQRIDERIESFVDEEINNSEFGKVFSKRSFGQRRMWTLYPRENASENDSALIYDEESSAFSRYDIDMNSLGYGGDEEDKAIDDFGDQTLEDFGDSTLQDFFFDGGTELLLGGNTTGEIFVMEQGGDDNEIIFSATIVDVTQATQAVVQMTDDIGLTNGDIVTISEIATGSMVELNDREFTVSAKSGNEFTLLGEDTTGFAAYVAGSDGFVRTSTGDPISLTIESSAWNPWIAEGKQAQFGYLDLFLDTHISNMLTVEFFLDNDFSPYLTKTINLLPNLGEIATVSGITNANPGQVTAGSHGLATGGIIYLYNVAGMPSVNDTALTVTVVDGNNFTIGVDTTDRGVWTNGGIVTDRAFSSTKAWKRVYVGGTGYQHKIKITSEGRDKSVRIHAFMPWFKQRGVRPI